MCVRVCVCVSDSEYVCMQCMSVCVNVLCIYVNQGANLYILFITLLSSSQSPGTKPPVLTLRMSTQHLPSPCCQLVPELWHSFSLALWYVGICVYTTMLVSRLCKKNCVSAEYIRVLSALVLFPGPLRGGERAWYTLNAHAPTFSVKFAVKLTRYFWQHVAKYTEKLGGLRIRSSLQRRAYTS